MGVRITRRMVSSQNPAFCFPFIIALFGIKTVNYPIYKNKLKYSLVPGNRFYGIKLKKSFIGSIFLLVQFSSH